MPKKGLFRKKQANYLNYLTPEFVLDCARAYFGGPIPLDAATAEDNPTKALRFYTPKEDGLKRAWDEPTWVNPPYGVELNAWLCKIAKEASKQTIIALLPANRSEGSAWQRMAYNAEAVCFIRKRLSFLDDVTRKALIGNTYASIIWGFNVDLAQFALAFSKLGLCMALRPLSLPGRRTR